MHSFSLPLRTSDLYKQNIYKHFTNAIIACLRNGTTLRFNFLHLIMVCAQTSARRIACKLVYCVSESFFKTSQFLLIYSYCSVKHLFICSRFLLGNNYWMFEDCQKIIFLQSIDWRPYFTKMLQVTFLICYTVVSGSFILALFYPGFLNL